MNNSLRLVGLAVVPVAAHCLLRTHKKNPTNAFCFGDNSVTSTVTKWDDNWDGMHQNESAKNKKRTFILVRHGQYEAACSDEGRILTELGRQQAQSTGDRLATLLAEGAHLPPLDSIVYSTMTRATETHDIIYKQLLPSSFSSSSSIEGERKGMSQACDLIREGAVCRPEPDTWRGPTDKEYLDDNARIEKAFQKYFHRSIDTFTATTGTDIKNTKSTSTLFVCHGNVIRYFVMRVLQLPPEAWLRTSVANASITIVNIHSSGRVSLQCMGDTGHLTPSQITYN